MPFIPDPLNPRDAEVSFNKRTASLNALQPKEASALTETAALLTPAAIVAQPFLPGLKDKIVNKFKSKGTDVSAEPKTDPNDHEADSHESSIPGHVWQATGGLSSGGKHYSLNNTETGDSVAKINLEHVPRFGLMYQSAVKGHVNEDGTQKVMSSPKLSSETASRSGMDPTMTPSDVRSAVEQHVTTGTPHPAMRDTRGSSFWSTFTSFSRTRMPNTVTTKSTPSFGTTEASKNINDWNNRYNER